MTPTSVAAGSSARTPYDPIVSGAPVETYDTPYAPGDAGAAVGDAATFGGGQTAYVDDAASAYAFDPRGGSSSGASLADVAGTQPAITATYSRADAPSIDDFAALGIFSDAELEQIAGSGMSADDAAALYDEAVRFMQSPEFADYQVLRDQPVAGATSVGAGDATVGAEVGVAGGEPAARTGGWSSDWNDAFHARLDELGIDSKTQLMVTTQLKGLGLGDAELQQALDYYTGTEEGVAELRAVDDQVRAGDAQQAKMMLAAGGVAALGLGGAYALSSSTGNLRRVLERTAVNGVDDASRAAARAALRDMSAGSLRRGTDVAARASDALRAEGAGTSRLLHPIRKASVNAAARNLATPTRLTRKELVQYALWMNPSENAARTARSAGNAARMATTAADTASRTASGVSEAASAAKAVSVAATEADDVARAASTAAGAAKGIGAASKIAKAAGPIGLVISAGLGAWGISETMKAEGGFGKESAKMTGNVVGGMAGGAAGAAIGAALLAPTVVGAPIGAMVGGVIGGLAGGWIGEHVGGFLHDVFS